MYIPNLLPMSVLMSSSVNHPVSQISADQSNLLHHLGGMGPYVQNTGYGIPLEPEWNVQVDKVFVFARHGERFPTTSLGNQLKDVFMKLKYAQINDYKGPLEFVEDWEFFIPNDEWLEMETLYGQFSGLTDMYEFGKRIRMKYGYLYKSCEQAMPFFAASKQRCVDSAEGFAKGFFNNDEDKIKAKARLVILKESSHSGADTLATGKSCKKFIGRGSNNHPFEGNYMIDEAKRLNTLSPGFNLNAKDIFSLAAYCAFELNASGKSKVCDALSMDTFLELEYLRDTELWYERAAHPYSFVLGSVYVDAMLKLFEDDEVNKQNLWFSFTHDTDLLYFMNALGVLEHQHEPLNTEKIDIQRFFRASQLVPMGARIIVERMTRNSEKYIRVLINDSVMPIPSCQDGPGFSCKLGTLRYILDGKLEKESFVDKCKVLNDRPQELTFYWDWEERLEAELYINV